MKDFEANPDARLLNASFDQAYTMISSSKARAAFDLSQEPDSVKDRYGRNRFGMSCLLARRLVESGVRFVTVNMFETVFNEITWDIHGSAPFSPIEAYRDLLGPMFDNAYASLLEDLTSRGLLDNTMVVAMGEFGRTPKINPAGGRDHWPQCWTVSMAGGGIKGGQVIGASDEIGAYPKDRPVPAGSRRGDDAARAGDRPREGSAGAAEPAHSRRRPRGRADRGAVLAVRAVLPQSRRHDDTTARWPLLRRVVGHRASLRVAVAGRGARCR